MGHSCDSQHVDLRVMTMQSLVRETAITTTAPALRYEDALAVIKKTRDALRLEPVFSLQDLPDTAMVVILSLLGDEVHSVRVSKQMNALVTRAMKSNRYWLSRLEVSYGGTLSESDFVHYDARELYIYKRLDKMRGPDTPDSWLVYMYRTSPDSIDNVALMAISGGRLGMDSRKLIVCSRV